MGKNKIQLKPRYVGTHTNVHRNVILGKTDGGGSNTRNLNKEPQEVRSQLRILYETPGIPPHPLSAHPRVPERVRQAVIDAVLRLAEDKEGQVMLKAIQMSEPLRADYQRDYKPLEGLDLERYVITGVE
jgi:phosphonate transport system substrate-binding protein